MIRVFILCTGRCGSTTFIKACNHIENFSAGHETLSNKIGAERFNYPCNHIEADNRLSWFLGTLDKIFGQDAFYVHLVRRKNDTVNSYNKRWYGNVSIIKSFCEGILMTPIHILNETGKLKTCEFYYETINDNINLFLRDKNKMTINIDSVREDFILFWKKIGARGELNAALNEFKINYNSSKIDIYEDNCSVTIETLLKELNIDATKDMIKNKIMTHPEYPSLLCICDTLKSLKINNIPLKCSVEQLKGLKYPFITLLKYNKRQFFITVKDIDNQYIQYYDETGKLTKKEIKHFLYNWTEIVVLAELDHD